MQWKTKKNIEGKVKDFDAPAIVHMLLLQRGVTTAREAKAFFTPDYEKDLHDPFLFKDMRKVIERVQQAREKDELVGIFGDHDVDGVSGATILTEALEALEVRATVYIPSKHGEGHGINMTAVDKFKEEGVTLLISVDCGSTDHDEIAAAKKHGMDTIIIDHHNTPEVLPDAYAVINPKVPDCGYPFDGLCGTGTAFKVVTALFHELLPERVSQLKWLLDIVSVATVADCMSLTGENRTLVSYGLLVLSKTRRIAYEEMIAVGRIPISEEKLPDAQMIAFQIAPRLNAAGRMAHARDAYEFLVEKDRAHARVRALDLESKNKERRKITDALVKEVEVIAQKDFDSVSSVLIGSEQYPVGVIGIIAGRIASKYGKPTGIFHKGDTESQGSFRGIEGVSLVKALEKCSDLLIKFGGHDQAAGATLANEDMEAFQKCFAQAIDTQLQSGAPTVALMADAEMSFDDVNHALAAQLKKFAPFGQDNAEPLFLFKNIILVAKRGVGKGEKHMKISVRAHGSESAEIFDAIWFSGADACKEFSVGDAIDLLAHVQENVWNGRVSVQLMVVEGRGSL